MKEKYLPIGTIVTLKEATKRIMIIGYLPMTEENKMFDYSACTFPEGVMSMDKTLAFNHDQISQINFMGLEDNEQVEFNNKVKEMLNGVAGLRNVELPNENGAQNIIPTENNSQTNSNIPTLDLK